jgi:hypothetical protein
MPIEELTTPKVCDIKRLEKIRTIKRKNHEN